MKQSIKTIGYRAVLVTPHPKWAGVSGVGHAVEHSYVRDGELVRDKQSGSTYATKEDAYEAARDMADLLGHGRPTYCRIYAGEETA